MFVRNIAFPVKVLGPGQRLGIWVAGCARNCRGCMTPELLEQRPEDDISLELLTSVISSKAQQIDGVTVSGGEPFEQAKDLAELLTFVTSEVTEDVLVYTGYRLEQLSSIPYADNALQNIATLIDGAYVMSLDDGVGIRGSSNQRVHRFKEAGGGYDYEGVGRAQQHFAFGDTILTVGLK